MRQSATTDDRMTRPGLRRRWPKLSPRPPNASRGRGPLCGFCSQNRKTGRRYLPELRFALGEPELDTTTIDNAAFTREGSLLLCKTGSNGFRIGYQPTIKKVVSDWRALLDEGTEVKNRLKQFRRIATRYEKTAGTYLSMLCIAATRLWIKTVNTA
jgi:hypothetical protein